MSKYSSKEKLKVVVGVVEKGMSYKEASKQIGADESAGRRWVSMYQEHGVEGLVLKNGSYDGGFKITVIEYMHANKLSQRETAAKFGIPSFTTVGKWERIYYEEGRDALYRDNRGRRKMSNQTNPKKVKLDEKVEEDLIAEVQRLRMENAYLKKLQALVQARVQQESGRKQKSLMS